MIKLTRKVSLQLFGGVLLLGVVLFAFVSLVRQESGDYREGAPRTPHQAATNSPEVVRKDVGYQ